MAVLLVAGVRGGEVVCETARLDLVGDVGERVPPPGWFLEGDALRIEHPHRPVGSSDVSGRVDDVAFVRRHQHPAGSGEDRRYGP